MITLGIALGYAQTLDKLTPSEKYLILDLINKLDDDPTGHVTGSLVSLSNSIGISPRGYQRLCTALKERGIISVKRNTRPDGANMPNSYSLPAWPAYVDLWHLATDPLPT